MEFFSLYGTYVVAGIALVSLTLLAYVVLYISRLETMIKNIPHLKLSDSLRTDLNTHATHIQNNDARTKQNAESISRLAAQLSQLSSDSYHSVVIRYNPFKDSNVGGNQSFTAVFANQHGNGLIISSLYSREMNRVSSKELIGWNNADYDFSPEEKVAISQLKSRISS